MRVKLGLNTETVVVLGGVCAAMHIGKMPVALPLLQAQLSISLVQAGFLLSLVQGAGMLLGLLVAVSAHPIGLKRSLVIGSFLMGCASLLGSFADSVVQLLLSRVLEGLGFLLVALPAPSLIRRLVSAEQLPRVMGRWGAYMPGGMALALLLGPGFMDSFGWRIWWVVLGALSCAMAVYLARRVPADPPVAKPWRPAAGRAVQETLGSVGPWLVALCFAVYSLQWVAVLGFLPSIYAQAGVPQGLAGWMTALVAAANVSGNLAAGLLAKKGWSAPKVLSMGYLAMMLGAMGAFALPDASPLLLRYGAIVMFSAVGGVIPGTLFALAVRLAPGESTVLTTVGWMHQCSALGQFSGPPLLAWVVAQTGSWQWTWVVTASVAVMGIVLSRGIRRRLTPRRQLV